MSIHLACPHCQALLVIADGCEGRSTRCPGCVGELVVPGASAGATTELPCAVMTPVAGSVTPADLESAKASFDELAAENAGLAVELARHKRRRQRQATRLRMLELFQSGRELLDHSFGRNGGIFIAVVIVPALFVLAVSVFSPSAVTYLLVIAAGMVLGAAAYVPFSFYPEDEALAVFIVSLTEKLKETTSLHQRLATEEAAHHARLESAEADYLGLKAAIESRLHWLRTCQWQQMSGRGFTNFVQLALEEHGLTVAPGHRADAWRNQIIAVRDEKRLAVQAQGGDQPVDTDVVEQAQRARSMHGCQDAAVITNSRFTAPAKELADRVGCRLIDGSQIPDLIEGRIAL